jgi:hypothetical protein
MWALAKASGFNDKESPHMIAAFFIIESRDLSLCPDLILKVEGVDKREG